MMCHRFLVYLHLVYLHLLLISVPSLVYLGISVPWADIPRFTLKVLGGARVQHTASAQALIVVGNQSKV